MGRVEHLRRGRGALRGQAGRVHENHSDRLEEGGQRGDGLHRARLSGERCPFRDSDRNGRGWRTDERERKTGKTRERERGDGPTDRPNGGRKERGPPFFWEDLSLGFALSLAQSSN